jgi:ElaB/YqjD/DUF883 family membrane-anchored ribosome-binding protein
MSTSTNPGERSAAEIEREVEMTRARLTGTVEQLKERVSPGQVAEQAMDWLRSSGGREFVGNLGSSVRDNPMPVLLIAAGIGWLALSGGRSSASNGRYTAAPSLREPAAYPGESYPAETYAGSSQAGPVYYGAEYGSPDYAGTDASSGGSGSRMGEAASGLRDRAGDLAGRAGETASQAWDSVTGAAASVREGAASTGRGVADRASKAWNSATGTASHLTHRVSHMGGQAGRGLAGMAETQPLLLGALGVALGAALGAMLPGSEAEDRLMGESRDRVASRLQELAGDAYQQARQGAGEHLGKAQEALGEVYSQARERLAESGVSVQGGAQALGEVARELRETVEHTARDAANAARTAAERPGGQTPGSGTA